MVNCIYQIKGGKMLRLEPTTDWHYNAFYVYQDNKCIGLVTGDKQPFGTFYIAYKGKKTPWLHCADLHLTKEDAAEHLIKDDVKRISIKEYDKLYSDWWKSQKKIKIKSK